MNKVARLKVSLDFSTPINVGELVKQGQQIFFRYHPEILDSGLDISPIKLPLQSGPQLPDTTVFAGLFGVFNDSLPDGWGRLLLDRAWQARGVSLTEIGPLKRLATIGRNGMGALIYEPIEEHPVPNAAVSLDQMAAAADHILRGDSSELVETLLTLGGSSGGARPKVMLGYHPQTNELLNQGDHLPPGFEHWIIKFPATNDPKDVAELEYAYHLMAVAAGIEMSPCQLFTGASGRKYFGTKRFDRQNGQRLHMHSAAGLMHDNFRLSNMDYGHLLDAAFRLEQQVGAYEKVFRLAAFNVFAHNRDDHSKNFSFLMNEKGQWRFAPAYDLTFSFSGHGQHSTTVAGEGASPTEKHLLALAAIFSIRRAEQLLKEVQQVINDWPGFAEQAGVSANTQKWVAKTLFQR